MEVLDAKSDEKSKIKKWGKMHNLAFLHKKT